MPAHALVAHYTFDEGAGTVAADSSSNNFDGTLVGPSWSDGRIGNALSFDGQDDRVELGAIDITGSALTIMAWINITAFTGSSSDGRIISKANDTAENGHYWMLSTIDSNGSKFRFRLKTGGTTTTLIGGDAAANEWVHVTAVYDGSFMRLYKDGGEVASVAKSGTISTNNSVSAWIGDQPPSAGLRPWNGKIDEVRLYEEALTAQEIQFAMNNGNAFPQVSLTSPAHNQQFNPGEAVQLSANASDADGTVALVEFYAGDNKIGEDYTSPYTAQWPNPAEGTYQITAKAIDNEASFAISSPPHQIRVGGGGPTQGWQHKSTERGDLDTPTTNGDQQTATLVLDINMDGITDFVITDRSTQPSVVWYESSANGSWIRRVLDSTSLRIEAGGTYTDIDGDGDPDIVFAGDGSSNEIWWWENPFPDFSQPWPRRYIKNSGSNKYHDQMFGDFDGDGSDELASWNQGAGELILFEIPQDPQNTEPWPYSVIASASGSHEGMAVFDVDNDDIEDIVGAGRWYKHISGTTYSETVVDANQTFGRAAAGQFVPGGYAELVFGPGDNSGNLSFYQSDGIGGWDATLLKAGVDHGHSLHTADFNQDGHLDIFCAEMRLNGGNSDAKSWIFYGDGAGNFIEEIVSEGIGNHESRPADLDGDGDMDILGKPYNWDAPRLDIWLNNGTGSQLPLNLWERHLIDGAMPNNSVFIKAADLNSDQDLDLIAGAWWWQNPGTLDGIWTRHLIGNNLNNMGTVHDFDGDNDLDVFGTTGTGASSSHEFRWAQNDGFGNFSILDNIQTGGSGDFLQGCLVDNFGSGEQVVLSWHNGGGGVQALDVPSSPSTENWPFSTLSPTTLGEELTSGDIDLDGDADILLGTQWLENDSGSWLSHTIGQVTDLHAGAEPDRNSLADIDGDGRLDAVISLENGTSILWFKNPTSPTGSWERHVVGTVAGQGFSMDVADFDNDADPDIVIGEHRGSPNNRVIIFENINDGTSWQETVIDSDLASNIDHHDGTQAVDLDKDGDLDLISIGWYNQKVWVYENKAIDGVSGNAPVINVQPSDTTVNQGQSAVFSVSASGTGQLLYQWKKDGIDIPFATTPTLETQPLNLADHNSTYACTVSNGFGQVTTRDSLLSVLGVSGGGLWWDTSWRYRIPVSVNSAAFERHDFPVEVFLDFSQAINDIGGSGEFDEDSIRVVEVTDTGAIVNPDVVFQFDQDVNYDPNNNAIGTVAFILHGTSALTETRYFEIYFETIDAGISPATIPNYVEISDGIQHKGFSSLRVATQNATWFFHKEGGGFASLLDSKGQDWIGFINNNTSAASGWYRGVPNAIYPEDMMHPGRTGCQSVVTSQGAVRAIIESTCADWKSIWTVYPTFAQMSMEAADHDYWFQYEGTPGGSTEATDFLVTSDGVNRSASTELTGDIAAEEWAYVGDSDQERALFLAHHEDDPHPERFYRMEGGGGDGMIIFAFGRGAGTTRYLATTPQLFSVGFTETKDFPRTSTSIRGAINDASITVGNAKGFAQPTVNINEVYFGEVATGAPKDQTIILTNNGITNLTIGQIATSNPLVSPFFIVNDGCSNQILLPGETCTIVVRFIPPDQNDYADSFDIPTNGIPPNITVNLYSGMEDFPWILFMPAIIGGNSSRAEEKLSFRSKLTE